MKPRFKKTPELGVSGLYSFQIIRPDGTVRKSLQANKNLILDQGLDILNNGSANFTADFAQCTLGTGTSEPLPSDTSLTAPVGAASNSVTLLTLSWSEISPGVFRMRRPFRFEFNTAGSRGISGVQLSEVAVGTAGANPRIISKSLIKDAQGNPTTIQLLPEEILRVVYTIELYFDASEQLEGIFILNEGEEEEEVYEFEGNFLGLGNTTAVSTYAWTTALRPTQVYVATQRDLVPVTSQDTLVGGLIGVLERNSYSEGAFKNTYSARYSVAQGNVSGGIGYIRLQPAQVGMLQMRIARQSDGAPIPKTNEYRLNFEEFFHISITRYERPDEANLPPIETPEEP